MPRGEEGKVFCKIKVTVSCPSQKGGKLSHCELAKKKERCILAEKPVLTNWKGDLVVDVKKKREGWSNFPQISLAVLERVGRNGRVSQSNIYKQVADSQSEYDLRLANTVI